MKYTTYNTVAQITTQNAEKYQSDRGKLESTCLPARLVSAKKLSV